RPGVALSHLASADNVEPAFGDVRSRVVRDAVYDGAGAGIQPYALRKAELAEAAQDCKGHHDTAGDRGRDAFDTASIVIGIPLPDRAQQAACTLVLAAAAGVLPDLGDRARLRDDDLRILSKSESLQKES